MQVTVAKEQVARPEWCLANADVRLAQVIAQGYYGDIHKATWRGVDVAAKARPYLHCACIHRHCSR